MKKYNEKINRALNEAEVDDILGSFRTDSVSPVIEEIEPPKRSLSQEAKKEKRAEKPSGKKRSIIKKLLITGAVAVAVALAVGAIFGIVESGKTAYLKPYKEKYGIDFPNGIAEEFCDAYGENQDVVGRLIIKDTGSTFLVLSQSEIDEPHFEGENATSDELQFRSIRIRNTDADIEKAYSSLEKYSNATQRVTFTDIFGKRTNYRVIGAFYTNTLPTQDNGKIFAFNVSGTLTEDSFDDYEDRISTRFLYKTGRNISYYSKYLIISANSDFLEKSRFVIICEMVDGDVEPITNAIPNEKIHYPQAWYDANNEHNPYWLAGQFRPEYINSNEK